MTHRLSAFFVAEEPDTSGVHVPDFELSVDVDQCIAYHHHQDTSSEYADVCIVVSPNGDVISRVSIQLTDTTSSKPSTATTTSMGDGGSNDWWNHTPIIAITWLDTTGTNMFSELHDTDKASLSIPAEVLQRFLRDGALLTLRVNVRLVSTMPESAGDYLQAFGSKRIIVNSLPIDGQCEMDDDVPIPIISGTTSLSATCWGWRDPLVTTISSSSSATDTAITTPNLLFYEFSLEGDGVNNDGAVVFVLDKTSSHAHTISLSSSSIPRGNWTAVVIISNGHGPQRRVLLPPGRIHVQLPHEALEDPITYYERFLYEENHGESTTTDANENIVTSLAAVELLNRYRFNQNAIQVLQRILSLLEGFGKSQSFYENQAIFRVVTASSDRIQSTILDRFVDVESSFGGADGPFEPDDHYINLIDLTQTLMDAALRDRSILLQSQLHDDMRSSAPEFESLILILIERLTTARNLIVGDEAMCDIILPLARETLLKTTFSLARNVPHTAVDVAGGLHFLHRSGSFWR